MPGGIPSARAIRPVPQVGQNCTVSHVSSLSARHSDARLPVVYQVLVFVVIELVGRQVLLIPLAHCVGAFGHEIPAVALLGADAAIALIPQLDLGHFDLVHKGPAVAVASVRLQGLLLGFCHGGRGEIGAIDLRGYWWGREGERERERQVRGASSEGLVGVEDGQLPIYVVGEDYLGRPTRSWPAEMQPLTHRPPTHSTSRRSVWSRPSSQTA